MSMRKFDKHQKSRKPNFVATDPITKKVLFSSNTSKEFVTKMKEYRRNKKASENNE